MGGEGLTDKPGRRAATIALILAVFVAAAWSAEAEGLNYTRELTVSGVTLYDIYKVPFYNATCSGCVDPLGNNSLDLDEFFSFLEKNPGNHARWPTSFVMNKANIGRSDLYERINKTFGNCETIFGYHNFSTLN